MTYWVRITDRTTGETRTKVFNEDWDGLSDFDWGMNNRSCDCNRAIYFNDAGATVAPEECGDWRFSIRITDAFGKLLFEDRRERLIAPKSGRRLVKQSPA